MKISDLFKSKQNKSFHADGFNVDISFAESMPEEEPCEEKSAPIQEVFEWMDVLTASIIAVVIIFSLLFRVATIEGDSMEKTLSSGDRIIITDLAYEPQQGDIVVISRNADNSAETQEKSNSPIIKRVIAVGGQMVDIDFIKGIVYVDGVALEEDYINNPTDDQYDVEFPVYIPEGYIFVLGDNRGYSLDSRTSSIGDNGLIDSRYVLGHAVLRFYPFESFGRLDSK